MTITDIVPIQQTTGSADQQNYRRAMIEAARRAQITGWGADGSIVGIEEEVRSQRLWMDQQFPVTFSPEALATAKRALISDGQQNAIKVVKLQNPAAQMRSHDGTTDQDLLIVDIDGALIFTAAATTSIDQFKVKVEAYTGEYYNLLLRMGNLKAQQYQLRRSEKGRLYRYAQTAHETEQAMREQKSLPKLKNFPGMRELAPKFGCASAADLSLCVAMSEIEDDNPEIITMLDRGHLTEDQIREIVAAPSDQRLEIAQRLAQYYLEAGRMQPRDEVRQQVRLVSDKGRAQPIPWNAIQRRVPVTSLWTYQVPPTTQEVPVTQTLGRLLHDIEYCLDESESETPKEAQALIKRMRGVLQSREAVELMQLANQDQS